jgi:hypothetical protein
MVQLSRSGFIDGKPSFSCLSPFAERSAKEIDFGLVQAAGQSLTGVPSDA